MSMHDVCFTQTVYNNNNNNNRCEIINLQIVDGCITNDGDAFLYGARTVYKDLCISGKVRHLQTNLFKLHY